MLDVLANANRRIKHSTPGLSTMNTLSGFLRRERSTFRDGLVWVSQNVILFAISFFA